MQLHRFGHRHLLGIEGLSREDIEHVLDLADTYVELSRQAEKKSAKRRGRMLINCFFENSTAPAPRSSAPGKVPAAAGTGIAVNDRAIWAPGGSSL